MVRLAKLATCVVLLLASPAWSIVVLSLPETVSGDVDAFIQIPATTTGAVVKWYPLDKGGNLFPMDLLKDTKTAVMVCRAAGSYRILAYTADPLGNLSDPVICTVVVGGVPPVPPTPPTPPAPPTPADVLFKPLMDAYAAEADVSKEVLRSALADIYDGGAKLAATAATWGDLFDGMKKAADATDVSTKLPLIQKVLQAEWQARLPVDRSKALTQDGRALAVTQFTRVSALLRAVGRTVKACKPRTKESR